MSDGRPGPETAARRGARKPHLKVWTRRSCQDRLQAGRSHGPADQPWGCFVRVSIVAVAACVAFASRAASPVSAQAADVWQVTQGVCGDWKGTWVMEHVGPGHWMGKSVIRVESNQCSHSPIGTQLVANVDFTTRVDRTWTATGTDAGTGRQCRYSGAVTSG